MWHNWLDNLRTDWCARLDVLIRNDELIINGSRADVTASQQGMHPTCGTTDFIFSRVRGLVMPGVDGSLKK